jgi:hypothetical protein
LFIRFGFIYPLGNLFVKLARGPPQWGRRHSARRFAPRGLFTLRVLPRGAEGNVSLNVAGNAANAHNRLCPPGLNFMMEVVFCRNQAIKKRNATGWRCAEQLYALNFRRGVYSTGPGGAGKI